MSEQYKVDEFTIVLLASLLFFLGLTIINYFFYNIKTLNIQDKILKNQTFFLSKQFLLDGLEKTVTLFEIEDIIYKSFFEEKKVEVNLEIPKDEVGKISKLKINFSSEKNISKLYLKQDELFVPAKNEYNKNEIKQKMYFIAKIEYYNISSFIFILSVIIVFVVIISYLLYQQYPKIRDKIKIIGISTIFAFLVVLFSLASIRSVDKINLNIYGIKDTAEKTFRFSIKPQIYNITIKFDIGESLRTNNLRIYLNDEIIYDNIPFTYSVRITLNNIKLNPTNLLKFETSNAKYEIKNLYILFS